MIKHTNLSSFERHEIISNAVIAVLSRPNFNTLGVKPFFDFLRLVHLDTAAIKFPESHPPEGFKYNDPEYQSWQAERQAMFMTLNNEDNVKNFGGHSGNVLSYIKKHHPNVYQSLLPWIEVQNE